MIAAVCVSLLTLLCITRVVLFVASPDPARGFILVPILLVGMLAGVRAGGRLIDADTHITNVSDLLYMILCIASVATTLLFMSTLHPPNRPSPGARIMAALSMIALIAATSVQWIVGPYHTLETPNDGSVYQTVHGLNYVITLPALLYIAVGVGYAGFDVFRYSCVPGTERLWRVGMILMAAGIELAAIGNVLFIIRLFVGPGRYNELTSAAVNGQYIAAGIYSLGCLLPVATIVETRREIARLTPLWAALTSTFPGHTLDTGPNRSHEDLRKTASRRFVETVECLGMLTLRKSDAEHVCNHAGGPVRGLGMLLGTRPIAQLLQAGGTSASDLVFTGGEDFTEQRAVTLKVALTYNKTPDIVRERQPAISSVIAPT